MSDREAHRIAMQEIARRINQIAERNRERSPERKKRFEQQQRAREWAARQLSLFREGSS